MCYYTFLNENCCKGTKKNEIYKFWGGILQNNFILHGKGHKIETNTSKATVRSPCSKFIRGW